MLVHAHVPAGDLAAQPEVGPSHDAVFSTGAARRTVHMSTGSGSSSPAGAPGAEALIAYARAFVDSSRPNSNRTALAMRKKRVRRCFQASCERLGSVPEYLSPNDADGCPPTPAPGRPVKGTSNGTARPRRHSARS